MLTCLGWVLVDFLQEVALGDYSKENRGSASTEGEPEVEGGAELV